MGAAGSAGFSDVVVRNAVVHDNVKSGLITYGTAFDPVDARYAHANVSVEAVRAWRNRGDARDPTNSGNGIVLGSVDGGHVHGCTAGGNGEYSTAVEGPIGIWAYDSTRVVIEGNLSFANRTAHADGGGFGLDQNTSESVIQYNLSYGNDGPGVLLFGPSGAKRNVGNTVRFNISRNDGRFGGYHGGFSVDGGSGAGRPGFAGARIYHNTVVVDDGAVRPALMLRGDLRDVVVVNNVFGGAGNPAVAAVDVPRGQVTLLANSYSTDGDTRADLERRNPHHAAGLGIADARACDRDQHGDRRSGTRSPRPPHADRRVDRSTHRRHRFGPGGRVGC